MWGRGLGHECREGMGQLGTGVSLHWGAQGCAWPLGSHHGRHWPPGHRCVHTACSGTPGAVTGHSGLPMACTGIPAWARGSPCGRASQCPELLLGMGVSSWRAPGCPKQLPGTVPGARMMRGRTLGWGRACPPCTGPARASSPCVTHAVVPAGAVAAAGPARSSLHTERRAQSKRAFSSCDRRV